MALQPAAHPNPAVICGRPGCRNPGLVWLEDDEWGDYQRGERIFSIPGHEGVRIRVE